MNNINFNIIKNFSSVSLLWIIFSIMFFFFTIREYLKSRKGLNVPRIDLGFSDLNNGYNTTRDAIIRSDKASHQTAAISFFLAGLTALASLFLSL